jgi:ABC-type polysaccharide/polyol phosphate export permease
MSDLTNAYALHADLSDLQDHIRDEKNALKANKAAQGFFTVGTWIIYALFAAAMYAAPLWVLQTFFTANAGNWLAVAVLGVFLIVFPTALALGKHAGYRALSKRGIDPRWMGAIIAFFICSGIYFEATSASSQQQEKAFQQVENSDRGKALSAAPTVMVDSSLADSAAKAAQTLARCQANLGKPGYKHCNGDKARLEALQASQKTAAAASVQATSAAVAANQTALQQERDAHALPIAKMFSEFFSATVSTGAVIAALIAALIFEISHAMTIYNEWRLKAEIAALDAQLKQGKVNYFHHTGKQFNAGDFRDGSIIDLDKLRESGGLQGAVPASAFSPAPIVPGKLQRAGQAIAGEFAKAQAARNHLHNTLQGQAGKLGSKMDYLDGWMRPTANDPANVRESGGFRQSPEQLARVRELAADTTGQTYRQALRAGDTTARDMPLDAPIPAKPANQKPGATGLQNPALGSAEEQHPLPIGEPDKACAHGQEKRVHTLSGKPATHGQGEAEGLYEKWLEAVRGKACKPTVRDSRPWIQKRIAPVMTGSKTNDLKRIDRMCKGFFSRAMREGLMVINPNYTNGGKKYIWKG